MFQNLLIRTAPQNLHNNLLGVQFLRWRRKPRWIPVAKSKQFRIPQHPKQSEEEKLELMRLHNQYKTQIRSIRSYLAQECMANKEKTTSDHLYITPEEVEKDFQMRMKINNDWNKKISVERDEKLRAAMKEKELLIKEKLELAEIRRQDQEEKARHQVLKQIELSKNFITKENLDAKIEEILSSPTNHNFCIDLQKTIYKETEQ